MDGFPFLKESSNVKEIFFHILCKQVPRGYIRCGYFIVIVSIFMMLFDSQKQRFALIENYMGRTDRRAKGRTDGWTRTFIEMSGRI